MHKRCWFTLDWWSKEDNKIFWFTLDVCGMEWVTLKSLFQKHMYFIGDTSDRRIYWFFFCWKDGRERKWDRPLRGALFCCRPRHISNSGSAISFLLPPIAHEISCRRRQRKEKKASIYDRCRLEAKSTINLNLRRPKWRPRSQRFATDKKITRSHLHF